MALRFLEPVTLSGQLVTLQPLERSHEAELLEAARDGELWNLWYTTIATPEAVLTYIDTAMKQREKGLALPFVVRLKSDGRLVGSTRYMNADAVNKRVEIGGTWYSQSVQRSGVNTECKHLLLKHAFETLNCIAVEFRTHILNAQSRRAIERLGAKLDGILRNHQRLANGTLRDTCVYSIIESEWPTINAHLRWQMSKPR
jgi:RimJ/RimL family protein N-acetyltransferase